MSSENARTSAPLEPLVGPDCSDEINRGLRVFWRERTAEAKVIADQVVSFAIGDTYVDDVEFDDELAIVRVLIFWKPKPAPPEIDIIIERLKCIFGMPVRLWACGTVANFGESE